MKEKPRIAIPVSRRLDHVMIIIFVYPGSALKTDLLVDTVPVYLLQEHVTFASGTGFEEPLCHLYFQI
jgi:hypothetical protein